MNQSYYPKNKKRIFYGWWVIAACSAMVFFASGIFFRGFTVLVPAMRDSLGSIANVSGGDVFRSSNNLGVGSLIRFTCAQGADAELWIVELLTPTATGGTIESAIA